VQFSSPFSIYNIKRRMTALPPISEKIFQSQIQALYTEPMSDSGSEDSSNDDSDDSPLIESECVDEVPEHFPPSQCIFCDLVSVTVEENLTHMSSHGLHIPHVPCLIDLGTFISYLGTLVLTYRECLYCGHTKGSVQGIRQHMVAKGHCMINLDAGSELLEFWEFPEEHEEDKSGMSR